MSNAMMKDKKNICLIFALVFSFSTAIVGADQTLDRDRIIKSKLECFQAALEHPADLVWEHVCYAQDDQGEDSPEPSVSQYYSDSPEVLENTLDVNKISPPFDLKFKMKTGYRNDDLHWNIAGDINGANPNILSELTWRNVKSWQIKAEGQVGFDNGLVFDGQAGYGKIVKGDNQDSDYNSDNRTDEFSRSNNTANQGDVRDFSAGIGYRFKMDDFFEELIVQNAVFIPWVGYSHKEQNFRMQDGFQTIPATGAFAGLNSSYKAHWNGPWCGFQVDGQLQKLLAMLRFEYHFNEYYGQANWNLRSDFQHPKSFEHSADGAGIVTGVVLGYAMTENIQLHLGFDVSRFHADSGIDRTFFSDGSSSETQLNEVKWTSYSFDGGVKILWP